MSIVDLKAAYLQLRVDKELWRYQLVKYKGQTFCLTHLGFGLNSAPRILSKVLKHVLSIDDTIKNATSSYIDDILVDETKVSVTEVVSHLNKFGLKTKAPEALDGGAVLGRRLSKVGEELMFHRGNKIPEIADALTRRELFSVCGTLVGHYPIAGWLRVACSYIKRRAEGSHWEDFVGEHAMSMIRKVIERIKVEDPVRGRWSVPDVQHGVVWTDASKIALGAMLEINGKAIEDATWLRKKEDFSHINVAELEAVLEGVNLALKWGITSIELRIDSATVAAWLQSVVSAERRIHTKGAAEMLIKRRLGNLREMMIEFGLKIQISLVPTDKNKADVLTRVKKRWLCGLEVGGNDIDEHEQVCSSAYTNVIDVHNKHHVGVDRTLYLARKMDPNISREDVKRVVRSCEQCQSIEPAPLKHEPGEVSVKNNWSRLAIDVTHYRGRPYFSMVDCGPGRFAVWRELRRENTQCIVTELTNIFLESGPVHELLMDNSTVFRSQMLADMLRVWNVERVFRAAYRPAGNGIVERHHRTLHSLPIVLLGLRMTPNATGFSPFTAVTGTMMLCPQPVISRDIHKTTSPELLQTFLSEMQSTDFRQCSEYTCHSSLPFYVPPDLQTCDKVWLRVDRVRKSLEAPYTGPFEVLRRSPKNFIPKLPQGDSTVSTNMLKSAYVAPTIKQLPNPSVSPANPSVSPANPSVSPANPLVSPATPSVSPPTAAHFNSSPAVLPLAAPSLPSETARSPSSTRSCSGRTVRFKSLLDF
ncbi:Integrase catalytic core [Trinorchestia longiramus]|nr:Integrase catalytic core [Trinorchestia longiramus]